MKWLCVSSIDKYILYVLFVRKNPEVNILYNVKIKILKAAIYDFYQYLFSFRLNPGIYRYNVLEATF